MPYFPGMGYGIGTAALKGLSYKKEYDEAEALKQRQMKINEDAEKRARDLVDESIATSKNNRKKDEAAAESTDVANSAMYGIVKDPSASATTEAASRASSVTPESVSEPGQDQSAEQPNDNGGTIVDTEDGRELDTVTGVVRDKLPTTGAGGAVPKSAQKPGDIVRTGGLASKDKPGGYGVQFGVQPKTGESKSEADLRKGKSQVAPEEVTGFSSKADELHANAAAVEQRLNEALKTIQTRYSGDETMAKYLKSNVIAKVRPQIEAMRSQAEHMKQQAQFAQFTHDAGLFSEQLLGKLETGKSPAEIDAWLSSNAETAKKLGIDLDRFKGLHKNSVGAIVNDKGYIFPRAAILASANGSLPFTERLKYMQEADKMYKIQEDLRSERMRIGQQDPLRVEKWTLEHVNNFSRAYAKKDYEYSKAKELAATGGEFTVRVNGEEQKVRIPPQYKDGQDWLYEMSKSTDPAVKAVYEQVVRPLETDRSLYDTATQFLGGFRAHVRPVNQNTADREAGAAGKKTYATVSEKLRAEAEAQKKQNQPIGNNS